MSSLPRKMPKRAVLYPQDIVNIMGVKLRTAYRLIEKIHAANGNARHPYVIIKEFSSFTGIPEETILGYILD